MEISNIHINQYINGELQGNALAVFEEKLNADNNFRDKVNTHKAIDAMLMKNYLDLDEAEHATEKERLQPIFDEIKKKHLKETESKKPTIRRILPFVAAVAAACFLLFVFNPFTNNNSPAKLADQYFEAYTPGSLMSLPDTNAIKDPKQLLTQASQYYQNNEIENAIETLKKIAENSSAVYQQQANWYLALCYLKQNQTEKAKPLLEQLTQNSNKKEKAKAILRQLK